MLHSFIVVHALAQQGSGVQIHGVTKLCSFTCLGKVLQRLYWSKALCTAVWHQNGGIYFHFGAKHTCTNFALSHLKEGNGCISTVPM